MEAGKPGITRASPWHQEEEGDLASGVQAEEQDQRFCRQADRRKSKIIKMVLKYLTQPILS